MTEAVAAARRIDDMDNRADSLQRIARLRIEMGDLQLARNILAEAVAAARLLDDEQVRAWSLNHAAKNT